MNGLRPRRISSVAIPISGELAMPGRTDLEESPRKHATDDPVRDVDDFVDP